MHKLTRTQSFAINNTAHTHNYATAAVEEWEKTNTCVIDKYTQQFETQTNILATAAAHDIGGLIIYTNKTNVKMLAAFYDYENFTGTVFAQHVA